MTLPQHLHSIPHIVAAVVIASLGIFTYLKNRKAPVNRWFALFCLVVSLWYGGYGIAINATDLSGYFLWQKIAHTSVIFAPPIYFVLTLRLLRLDKFHLILFLQGLSAVIIYWLMWTTNLYFTGEYYNYSWGIYPKASPLLAFNAALTTLTVLSCFGLFWRVCRRVRREGPRDYFNQLKYMCVALAFVGCTPIDYLAKFGLNVYPFGYILGLIFALIMTYAIVKHHVMDIAIVFQKGLVYSILVAGVTLVYLVSVLLAEKLFQGILGYRSLIATLVAAVTIAVGFIPFKSTAEGLINRVFHKGSRAALTAENERLKQELVRSEKLKAISTLAAGMAHEIKNPLTTIKTFAEFIPEKQNDPIFMKRLHHVLTSETQRIQEVVQELLEFAKPKTPNLKPVDLGPIIKSTVDFLSSDLLKRGIQRTISCRHNSATIQADSDQLRQVLINLIQNAADAMPNGGMLTFATQINNGYLEMGITDTGEGISKELLPKIFDPFVTTKPNGTGLGLAMVQTLVRAHHGTISVASTPGHGTTFTLRVPL